MGESPLESQAIKAALSADWEQAISINKQIVKSDPENLEAHNRLGRAYSEIGQLEKAKSSYRAVLRHNPYNSIALKNVERLKVANGKSKITGSTTLDPDLFMEEPGKTKVLELGDLAKPNVLASLHTGDVVKFEAEKSGIVFSDAARARLGSFEGELAERLAVFLKAGNIYEAHVKSVKPTELRVFMREIKRTPKYTNTASFPVTSSGFKPYVHESAIDIEEHEVITEPVDTVAAEAEVAKKIASVETLAEQELDTSQEPPPEDLDEA